MEFSRQEYWGGLPFPPPGDLPNAEIEPASPVSLALAGRFFTTAPPGKPDGKWQGGNSDSTSKQGLLWASGSLLDFSFLLICLWVFYGCDRDLSPQMVVGTTTKIMEPLWLSKTPRALVHRSKDLVSSPGDLAGSWIL